MRPTNSRFVDHGSVNQPWLCVPVTREKFLFRSEKGLGRPLFRFRFRFRFWGFGCVLFSSHNQSTMGVWGAVPRFGERAPSIKRPPTPFSSWRLHSKKRAKSGSFKLSAFWVLLRFPFFLIVLLCPTPRWSFIVNSSKFSLRKKTLTVRPATDE